MKHYLVGIHAYHSDQFNETPMEEFLRSRQYRELFDSYGQRFGLIQTAEKLGDIQHRLAMTLSGMDRALVVAIEIDPHQVPPDMAARADLVRAHADSGTWFSGGLRPE